MRKQIYWKAVMFFAVIVMFIGLCISWHGILQHNDNQAYIGLATIGVVCASWWFWVMFVIRTIIKGTDRTSTGLVEIKHELSEVKKLLRDK
jgi:hypothetical protein